MDQTFPTAEALELPAEHPATIKQYLAEIDRLNKQMEQDREEIEKLKAETRALKSETERLKSESRAALSRLGVAV